MLESIPQMIPDTKKDSIDRRISIKRKVPLESLYNFLQQKSNCRNIYYQERYELEKVKNEKKLLIRENKVNRLEKKYDLESEKSKIKYELMKKLMDVILQLLSNIKN